MAINPASAEGNRKTHTFNFPIKVREKSDYHPIRKVRAYHNNHFHPKRDVKNHDETTCQIRYLPNRGFLRPQFTAAQKLNSRIAAAKK